MAAGLVLFMTQGMSLRAWGDLGVLDRELAVYRALSPLVGGVAVASYGSGDEPPAGVTVLPNRRGLPARLYAQVLPLAHRDALRGAGVFKTNQVLGGHAAARAAALYRRPLVVRAGFLWSEAATADHGPGSARARSVAWRERRLMRAADVVVVTTARLQSLVRARYGVREARVIPNYVDTRAFAPAEGPREPGSLIFVGRLAPEKNLIALLEALRDVRGASLTIVGDGPQRADLEAAAERLGVDARFAGRVAHGRLPELLGRAEAFVLPSLYEGHPKALIEAMACGLPVIGTDVFGIRDVVADGETGILCGTDAASLRTAVERLLGDAPLRRALGEGAHEAAQATSVEKIVELELDAIEAARRACPV